MQVMSGFLEVVEKLLDTPEEQAAALSQLSRFRAGEGIYGKASIQALAKVEPAYRWWQTAGSECPELQRVACRVLAQPTSACACERNWSSFGFIHRPIRNRLTPDRAAKLVYVFSNLRMLKQFTSIEYEEAFPYWPDSDDE